VKHNLKRIEVNLSALHQARRIYKENEKDLEAYLDCLLEWNDKINLVSRTVSRETLREHIVHSLIPAALGLTDNHIKWIDAGTGGGLPGIPLAISNRDSYWLLNDNVKKKMKAVDDIVKSIGLSNVKVLPMSISLAELHKGTGIVTKHAFKIDDLLRLLGSKPWKTIVMWKGVEGAVDEMNTSKKKLNCTIYEFKFGVNEPFYEGKGIVKIVR
jgi:16S rRNA (guanine527-N7)-methyltransferase